jgi:endoglucanase
MGAGINIGQYFDDIATAPIDRRWITSIKQKGFTNIRIPVKWMGASGMSDFRSSRLMQSVRQSVEMALEEGLFVVLNTHHEGWVGSPFTELRLNGLISLWSRILEEFANHSQRLSFQIFNEPWERTSEGGNGFSYRDIDRINTVILNLIRREFSDHHRVVHFACNAYNWVGAPQYHQLGPYDRGVAMTVHYYSPLEFTHGGVNSQYRWMVSNGDRVSRITQQFDALQRWSVQTRCPIYLGEFGVIHNHPVHPKFRPDVLDYYRAVAREARQRGWSYSVWDDNGWYRLLRRSTLTWDEDIITSLELRP